MSRRRRAAFADPGSRLLHFRDVDGTAEDFTETFHDNGPTDMPAMLRLYHEIGFPRPDPRRSRAVTRRRGNTCRTAYAISAGFLPSAI